MSGEGELKLGTAEKRRTLWILLWLNVAIEIGFFITWVIGDSNALLANGLDNSSDAVVYALSLLALSPSRTWKRGAARFSDIMLLIFASGVIADALRRFVEGYESGGIMMMADHDGIIDERFATASRSFSRQAKCPTETQASRQFSA